MCIFYLYCNEYFLFFTSLLMTAEAPKNYPIKLPLVPKSAPLYWTIKTAERVIGLLLKNASGIEDRVQYFIGNNPIKVPDKYLFGKVPVFFIPWWWAYTIGEYGKSIMLNLPEGKEDLLSDIETAKKYIERLDDENTRKSEHRRIRESWRRDMIKMGRLR